MLYGIRREGCNKVPTEIQDIVCGTMNFQQRLSCCWKIRKNILPFHQIYVINRNFVFHLILSITENYILLLWILAL